MICSAGTLISRKRVRRIGVAGTYDREPLGSKRRPQFLCERKGDTLLKNVVRQMCPCVGSSVRRIEYDEIAIKRGRGLWHRGGHRLSLGSCGWRWCRRLGVASDGTQQQRGSSMEDEASFCHGSWGVRFDCNEHKGILQILKWISLAWKRDIL